MESLSSKSKNFRYLLCVIDVFTKYAWVKTSKDKKGKVKHVLNAFMENDSNCKRNKLWEFKKENFTILLCKNG